MRRAYLWGLAGLLPLRALAESSEAPGIATSGFVQGALAVVEVLTQSSSRAALQLAALGADRSGDTLMYVVLDLHKIGIGDALHQGPKLNIHGRIVGCCLGCSVC